MGAFCSKYLRDCGHFTHIGRKASSWALGSNVFDAGVGLRASYRDRPAPVRNAREWTNLTYNLEMTGPEYVELVAEFHGGKGSARFDADSLNLIRKSKGE